MGLIKAAAAAAGGVFADEWKEYFKCDSLPKDVLMRKGRKTSPSNNKGNDDMISNGSKIDVADGQAALIIEDGKIIVTVGIRLHIRIKYLYKKIYSYSSVLFSICLDVIFCI